MITAGISYPRYAAGCSWTHCSDCIIQLVVVTTLGIFRLRDPMFGRAAAKSCELRTFTYSNPLRGQIRDGVRSAIGMGHWSWNRAKQGFSLCAILAYNLPVSWLDYPQVSL